MSRWLGRLHPRTIRGRVTSVAVAVLALALVLVGIGAVAVQQRILHERIESSLRAGGDELAAQVRAGAVPERLVTSGRNLAIAQVVVADGTVRGSTANVSGQPPIIDLAPAVGAEEIREVAGLPVDDDTFLVLALGTDGPDGRATVLVAETLEPLGDAREVLTGLLAVALPVVLAMAGVVIYLAVRRTLGSVERARREVAAIGSDELHRRLTPSGAGDEIDRLSATMNEMLSRLEAAYRREQRFVGDASHELRSPLAAIRSQLEVDLRRPDAARPQETERRVLAEITRLEGLVEDLLALARERESHQETTLVDLDEVVLEEAARHGGELVAIDSSAVSGGQVRGHRAELARAVGNLLANATAHATGEIRLTLTEEPECVRLTVDDDGPGIPQGERARVFDRFVRLQSDRDRRTGGAGLGLAITRAIVERHGGTIRAEGHQGVGARLIVELPLATAGEGAPAG